MVKTLIVNEKGKIVEGALKGYVGNITGYDSEENEVRLTLDDNTHVLVSSEMVEQQIKKDKRKVGIFTINSFTVNILFEELSEANENQIVKKVRLYNGLSEIHTNDFEYVIATYKDNLIGSRFNLLYIDHHLTCLEAELIKTMIKPNGKIIVGDLSKLKNIKFL